MGKESVRRRNSKKSTERGNERLTTSRTLQQPGTQRQVEGPSRRQATTTTSADRSYAPSLRPVITLVCALRIWSAICNTISDCDETYNYWEPLHYILYGSGFQTWEYSPVYALRSYTYLLFHYIPARLAMILHGNDKVAVFYFTRTFLAAFCGISEGLFYSAVLARFGKSVGRFTIFFLLSSSGIFLASTALLPSTFAMNLVMIVYYFWLQEQFQPAIITGVVAVLIGWPFVGLIFLPMALDCFIKKGVFTSLTYGVKAVGLVLLSQQHQPLHEKSNISSTIASLLPKPIKVTFPFLNIVLYNVFGGGGGAGSTLYGVEPPSYYIKNLLLNFNVAFILSLAALAVVAVDYLLIPPRPPKAAIGQVFLFMAPCYLWFTFMMVQPHKEERFMFPIYPLFCLTAAIALHLTVNWCTAIIRRVTRSPAIASWLSKGIVFVVLILCAVLSVSRVISVVRNYNAPFKIFAHFHYVELPGFRLDDKLEPSSEQAIVCIGKEWHRFPTSFFLPHQQANLHFVKSAFGGQLPQQFSPVNGTWTIPENFNDLNKEEPSRYVQLETCDYVVDVELQNHPEENVISEEFKEAKTWSLVKQESFLNAELSDSLGRAFYIPGYTQKHTVFDKYVLWKRVK